MADYIPVVIVATILLAGCIAPSPSRSPNESLPTTSIDRPSLQTNTSTTVAPTRHREETTATEIPTSESQPTATISSQPEEDVMVEYRIASTDIPDEIESVNVTFHVVFLENKDDYGACWRDTFHGRFQPTPTPIAFPIDDCYRTSPRSIDLANLEGDNYTDQFSAPSSFSKGHALVIEEVEAKYENGTSVPKLRVSQAASEVKGRPDGPYRVEFTIESYQDRLYKYWLFSESAESLR